MEALLPIGLVGLEEVSDQLSDLDVVSIPHRQRAPTGSNQRNGA